jgi:hypothetical protein
MWAAATFERPSVTAELARAMIEAHYSQDMEVAQAGLPALARLPTHHRSPLVST